MREVEASRAFTSNYARQLMVASTSACTGSSIPCTDSVAADFLASATDFSVRQDHQKSAKVDFNYEDLCIALSRPSLCLANKTPSCKKNAVICNSHLELLIGLYFGGGR